MRTRTRKFVYDFVSQVTVFTDDIVFYVEHPEKVTLERSQITKTIYGSQSVILAYQK